MYRCFSYVALGGDQLSGWWGRASLRSAMVSNAPLAVFRFLFGLLMALESFGAIATGWVYRAYVEPRVTFPLVDLPVRLAGRGMYAYFTVMGLAAVAMAVGWRYRLSATALAIAWTGAYLSQSTSYNNHYYLAVLLAWAMALLPAHRRAALDERRTEVRTERCPAWIPRAFRAQVAIVFGYAAVAKLYPGWLNGDYLEANFGGKGDRWLVGSLLVLPWFQRCVAYTGIAFDALVVPALLWRRTRLLAFAGLIVFNLFNSLVFRIGIFPYMVLALAVFFFEPRTIERVFAWLPGLPARGECGADARPLSAPVRSEGARKALLRSTLGVYFALQLLLPLRHHLIPGDVAWTDEGHRMSWRMMLRSKSGAVVLVARDPASGRTWIIDQDRWLTAKQRRRVATRPEMLHRFVRILQAHYAAQGLPEVELRAQESWVSLNGAPPAALYDPDVDLAAVKWRHFGHNTWVLDRPRR
jgi:vitamin K-dependent gamma-carboxylase